MEHQKKVHTSVAQDTGFWVLFLVCEKN